MSRADHAHNGGWWSDALRHPRRLWLRRAVFQVHLWAGLIVGLLATSAGLTGSAIVYREELDRKLAPSLYQVSAAAPLKADSLLGRVQHELPAFTVQSVDVGPVPRPWMFRLAAAGGERSTAYVDPATGKLLGVRGERQGLLNWLEALHTELLGGAVGTWINGVGAVGLLLLCLTGIVVWWPGRGRVRRALRIQLPGRWRRFNWDLHAAGGFWISLPLAVQAFTGIFLCFGFGWVLVLFGGRAAEFNEFIAAPAIAACVAPQATLQSMLERTEALHPGAHDIFILLPRSSSGTATLFSRTSDDLRRGRVTVTAYNPCSGALLKDADSRTASPALRATLFLDAFHFGLIGGNVMRAAWVLLGLAPGMLFITGFLLWWRRIMAPALAGTKQRKLLSSAARQWQ